VQMSLKFDTE